MSEQKPKRKRPIKKIVLRVFLTLVVAGLGFGLVVFATTGWGEAFGAAPEGARLERVLASKQHDGETFVNVVPAGMMGFAETPAVIQEDLATPNQTPPVTIPVLSPKETLATPPESGLRVTWMGHSTMLIEIDGARVLADPVWGERVSPSTILGPKRFHKPPIAIEEIPEIDAVIISHDHYDHLDMPSIKALNAREVRFYVPLGIGAHLERWGVPEDRIREFDWHEKITVPGTQLELISTPARHFSGRVGIDKDRTLWTSWTMITPKHRVFYSGDTGYSPHFKEIGEQYGPFDLTMLEVGAYHPAWGDIHLGPKNALQAHMDLGGKHMMPVHWGSFDLALHSWDQPAKRLAELALEANASLFTPRVGEAIEPTISQTAPWWTSLGGQ